MEGVNHVHILKIRRCRLIGNIYRMLQRQVPDREGFKLGISHLVSSQIFVIQLGKACCQLAASPSRSCNNHQGLRHLNVRIRTVAFLAYDGLNICRVALRVEVLVGLNAPLLQLVDELVHCRRVLLISGYNHAVDFQAVLSEHVDEPENLQVICDAEIGPGLVGCYVPGVDTYYDFRLILHLLKELYLGVLVKPRENSHGMLVLNQLAAEFQIQSLSPAAVYPLQDILRLFFNVLLCTETCFHLSSIINKSKNYSI